MNYLAHGWRYLDRPVYLAGTAVPDWMRVADSRNRVRPVRISAAMEQCPDESFHEFCEGILQHHSDDEIFHAGVAFQQVCEQLAEGFRQVMPDPYDHRPGLLGHIVTELLLDNELARRNPDLLGQYYQAVQSVSAEWIEASVNRITRRPTRRLAHFVTLFADIKFLADYAENSTLILRLNQVLQRARLSPIDATSLPTLNLGRRVLQERADELLP